MFFNVLFGHIEFVGVVGFDLGDGFRFAEDIDIDTSPGHHFFSHLGQKERVDRLHPKLTQDFQLLQVFAAFLQVQEVKHITVKINEKGGHYVLETWNLG